MSDVRVSSSDNSYESACSLKDISLFKSLDKETLAMLEDAMETRAVRKGRHLLKASENGQFVMFVVAGEFKVTLTNRNGKEYVVDRLGPGDFFGELSILTGLPRSADVEAIHDSKVLILSQQDFEKYVLSNAGLTRALLAELALRLRETTAKAGDLALLDVYRRIARVLASLVKKPKDDDEIIGVVEKLPTHKEIAALAATTREMVTRALRELQTAGHIEFKGKRLLIKSLPI